VRRVKRMSETSAHEGRPRKVGPRVTDGQRVMTDGQKVTDGQRVMTDVGPRVTVSLNEESFGASYEESGTSSSSATTSTSSSRSESSGSGGGGGGVGRDIGDVGTGGRDTGDSKDESSLYVNINLKKSTSSSSLSATLLDRPRSGFIRCRSDAAVQQTVGQRDLRCDPVKLHQKYREAWGKLNLPGETSHNKLRWVVREWMMGEEPS